MRPSTLIGDDTANVDAPPPVRPARRPRHTGARQLRRYRRGHWRALLIAVGQWRDGERATFMALDRADDFPSVLRGLRLVVADRATRTA